MSSLYIGKDIYTLLQASPELVAYVGQKTYPIVAEESTTYPFIIYRRSSLTPASNKDYRSESVYMDIFVVTERYATGIDISELVRDALERGDYRGTNVEDITLVNASEEYLDDAFIQNLTFKIDIE